MFLTLLRGVRQAMLGSLLGLILILAPASAGECDCSSVTSDEDGDQTWTITLQYERMDMGTLLSGSTEVSPTQVIDQALSQGGTQMFSVPTSMVMQRTVLRARYRIDEDQAVVLNIPFLVTNEMDMLMGMQPMAGGMGGMGMGGAMAMPGAPVLTSMTMAPINQLGDLSLLYQRDVVHDEEGNRLTLTGGLKFPTGNSEVRTETGNLVHAMMQPGTGSLDIILGASGRVYLGGGPDGKTWALVPGLGYTISGRNSLGYRFGNRFGYDLGLQCRLVDGFKLTAALNGITTGQDSQNGTLDPVTGAVAYQRPAVSLIDNVANTGGSFLYLSPGFSWEPTEGVTLTATHRIPVARSVRGTQIVTDGWTMINLSVGF